MSRLVELLALGRPLVMGILNVTPDSFSDGGKYIDLKNAVAHAREMEKSGVDIIDIGGESTRPGALPISSQLECDRVIPVIEAVRSETEVALSCDTSKAEVMQAAAEVGVDLFNDVCALRGEGSSQVVSLSGLPVCLMHMQGKPHTMQENPFYENIVEEIQSFFEERIAACLLAGISREKLILDVGFGFGKSPVHNLTLINRLRSFSCFNLPLLVGISRKSTISHIVNDRLAGSIAGALYALERGARIVRVHDVAETVAAVRIWRSMKAERVVHD